MENVYFLVQKISAAIFVTLFAAFYKAFKMYKIR